MYIARPLLPFLADSLPDLVKNNKKFAPTFINLHLNVHVQHSNALTTNCTNNHMVNLLFTTFCKNFSRKRRNICSQNVFYTICVCQDKSYLLLHIVKAKIRKPLFHQSIVWHIKCFATTHFCIHHSLLDGSTTPQ